MNSLEDTARTGSKSVQHCFQPIYYFSRFAGLWPFTIAYDSNRLIKRAGVRSFDILWFLISICLYFAGLFYIIDEGMHIHTTVMYFAIQVPSLSFGPLCISLDMFNRKKLVNMLDKFITFDREISRFRILFDYNKEARRSFFYTFTPILTATILVASYVVFDRYQFTFYNMFQCYCRKYIRYIICVAVSASFAIIIRSLYIRFAALNSLLRNRLKWSVNMHVNDSIDLIKFVGQQHAFLTDITDLLNVCYAFQILVSVASALIFAIYTTYGLSETFVQVEHFFNVRKLCFMVITLILFMGLTCTDIYYSSLLTNESRRTARIAHDIINRCHNADVNQSLAQLSRQAQLRYPIVTCGLFKIDWNLFSNMMAATTTYLVVALNLESTRNKN